MKIYSVSNEYINYLRSFKKLRKVLDNKENKQSHTRKYLGLVITKNDLNYYIPFSSPKDDTDYDIVDGKKKIRKSIVPIIRMTSVNENGELELKGKLKLSSMIPVPADELIDYDISKEEDLDYKIIVEKEIEFIKNNREKIIKNANLLYKQKTCENIIFKDGKKKPGYLDSTIDFLYAEEKCYEFCKKKESKDQAIDKENGTIESFGEISEEKAVENKSMKLDEMMIDANKRRKNHKSKSRKRKIFKKDNPDQDSK